MAAANNKELLQALAYSYFAENPYPPDSNMSGQDAHMAKWFYFFSDDADIKSLGVNLSDTFPYSSVLSDYKLSKSNPKIHPHVAIVYQVAKQLYDSNILDNNMRGYYFLDQNDPYMKDIKDVALTKLAKLFKLPFRADIMSAIDIIAVKKRKKDTIYQDFSEHILSADDTTIIENLSYGTTGKNTYRTLTNKYFLSRDMVGISLKMPVSVNSKPHLSIIGTAVGLTESQLKYSDPYTKFLSAIMTHHTDLETTIKKMIKFVSFDFRDEVNAWKAEVEFDYKAINLNDYNVNFNLLAWAGVGYNGQFKRSANTSEQFVGGASFTAAETFLRQYPEYQKITNELKEIRKTAFAFAITHDVNTVSPQFKSLRNDIIEAKKQLEFSGVVSGMRMNQHIKSFCDKYDKMMDRKEKSWDLYRGAVIRQVKGEPITKLFTSGEAPLEKNYHNSQGFWFLKRGGEEYLKQRIFLTIFGVITKKGFKIYDASLNQIKSALRNEFTVLGKKLMASLDAAPHILMS